MSSRARPCRTWPWTAASITARCSSRPGSRRRLLSSETGAAGPAGAAATESPALLALLVVLTATTGLVDAVSVLGLGRVFIANMTGNVVFLAFALVGIPDFSAARSLASLGAFLTGAVLGGMLATRQRGSRTRWLLKVSLIESGLFLMAGLAAGSYDPARREPVALLYGLVVTTCVAMGLRKATARRLGVTDMTTTVLTLTLTGLGADSTLAGGSNPRWTRRLASVTAMLTGAAVAAVLVLRTGLALPLLLIGGLTLVASLAYLAHPASRKSPPAGR